MTVAQKSSEGLSRRSLLTSGLAGGLLLAFHLPVRASNEPVQPPDDVAGKFAPNAFIRIDHSGRTTLVMPQVEMGQGVYTSIPMILAEELDADFSRVVLEHAPPSDKLYANPIFGIQATGNSNSIRAFWQPLRIAGRRRARHVGASRGSAMAGRAGELRHSEQRGHPSTRAGASSPMAPSCDAANSADPAKGRCAQGSQGFRSDRQAAEAA